MKNYSSGHETKSREFGAKRLNYPDNHIEVDNRLSWHLGPLWNRFGDEAMYVHLTRNRDDVAQSYMKRFEDQYGIMMSFCKGIRMSPWRKLSNKQRLQVCYDYVDTVNENIGLFIEARPNAMKIELETIDHDFKLFWDRVGAQGAFEKAQQELGVRHNASIT